MCIIHIWEIFATLHELQLLWVMKLNREKKVEKINTYNKKAKSCYNLTGKKIYKNRENDKNEPDYNKDHIFSNINTHTHTNFNIP